jgi:uncharacterized protein (DUF2252 family)
MPSTVKEANMSDATDLVDHVADYNKGRDPERLAPKYRAIADNPFSFLRGICHLFYAELPDHELLHDVPAAWICDYLQLENLGTCKGDNRLVYFDLNDFDEAVLAPCTWETVRLLTSILMAARFSRSIPPVYRQCARAHWTPMLTSWFVAKRTGSIAMVRPV